MTRSVPLNLVNLDRQTREYMLAELGLDLGQGTLYLSDRLNERGMREYPALLREAISEGNDATLAQALRLGGLLKSTERRRKPKGGYAIARLPRTAPETLAEGEFNRFYARGLCRRALEEGIPALEVYRAKPVRDPRPESKAKIGTHVRPDELLADLRKNIGVDPALGIPAGPNSGLSVRLP